MPELCSFALLLHTIHFCMYQKVLYLATLVGLPLLSTAQTTASAPRFYVGAGANLLTDVPFNTTGAPTLLGPSLTAGLQLAPRLALQVSAAYHWQQKSYTSSVYNYGTGTVGGGTSTYYYKYLTVPVLLRYTLTEPAARFHVDAMGGITVLYGHFNFTSTDPASSSTYYYPNNYSSSSTRANATLGPAIRYTLSPSIELTANGLVSAIVGDTYYRFSDRLFLNALVGVHYTFGQL